MSDPLDRWPAFAAPAGGSSCLRLEAARGAWRATPPKPSPDAGAQASDPGQCRAEVTDEASRASVASGHEAQNGRRGHDEA